MAFGAPRLHPAAVPRITARSGARAEGAMNSGPTGSVTISRRIPSIARFVSASSDQATTSSRGSSCSGLRAPHSAMETPGSSRTHRTASARTLLPYRSRASRSSARTAARYCEYRGWRNFGSLRRRSSPRKSVFEFMRPESRPRQSAIRQGCDAVPLAIRKRFPLGVPLEQVVGRLRGVERRDLAERLHLLGEVVADSDRTDAPVPVQRVERFRGLLEGHQGVGPVDLVDVDVLGAKTPERLADLLHDSSAARVPDHVGAAAPLEANLGGQDDAIAAPPALNGPADDLLGATLAISGRRVDERDPAVERRADGLDRALLVGTTPHPAADRPGAEPDARR